MKKTYAVERTQVVFITIDLDKVETEDLEELALERAAALLERDTFLTGGGVVKIAKGDTWGPEYEVNEATPATAVEVSNETA